MEHHQAGIGGDAFIVAWIAGQQKGVFINGTGGTKTYAELLQPAIDVALLQGPYRQTPAGAGAVKMVLYDARRGVWFGGVSPAKDNYVIGW